MSARVANCPDCDIEWDGAPDAKYQATVVFCALHASAQEIERENIKLRREVEDLKSERDALQAKVDSALGALEDLYNRARAAWTTFVILLAPSVLIALAAGSAVMA